ncbi:sec23/Sec24 helical domain-containing protein, putative [Eimeria necatrix]|uniref:Sec23/Sec24 helical domain-containing protein, putative n=1 Tax=Eimeria necatrix TaxID=51315 RepID=U6MM99_9EIME|nr:sec23/Sec24 helical domain-containing protein, putative [Eimeria necatrix]CDJ63564.1 sec23/Sec24 helical domain-containing protein, putative [Eimeria necatrix]
MNSDSNDPPNPPLEQRHPQEQYQHRSGPRSLATDNAQEDPRRQPQHWQETRQQMQYPPYPTASIPYQQQDMHLQPGAIHHQPQLQPMQWQQQEAQQPLRWQQHVPQTRQQQQAQQRPQLPTQQQQIQQPLQQPVQQPQRPLQQVGPQQQVLYQPQGHLTSQPQPLSQQQKQPELQRHIQPQKQQQSSLGQGGRSEMQYSMPQQNAPRSASSALGHPAEISASRLNGYPAASTAAPTNANYQASAWRLPQSTGQHMSSSFVAGATATSGRPFLQQPVAPQQHQPEQQLGQPQQPVQQRPSFYASQEPPSETMQQPSALCEPVQYTQEQCAFPTEPQQSHVQQRYQHQEEALSQRQSMPQQKLLQSQQYLQPQQQQQIVAEPAAPQQPEPLPGSARPFPSQISENAAQQQYDGSHGSRPQPPQLERRLPSLMGVGLGSFPSSAESNGVKNSPEKVENTQNPQPQQQQLQQQQQQDTFPEDMPPLQPLARPINNRIDPAHIPRPEWNEQITNVCGKRIETDKSGASPPSPAGFYTAVDKGCCSCRFMRSTINQVPAFSHSLELSRLPFALVVTPFAAQPPTEEAVPLVDLRISRCQAEPSYYGQGVVAAPAEQDRAGLQAQTDFFGGYFEVEDSESDEDINKGGRSSRNSTAAASSENRSSSSARRGANNEGIVRCSNCMAYISPFMSWASNSTHCVCNLCGSSFELPPFYLTLLDQYRSGLRGGGSLGGTAVEADRYSKYRRVELWKGSVDFVAPKAFAVASKLAQLQRARKAQLLKLVHIESEATRQQQLRQQQQNLTEQHGLQQQFNELGQHQQVQRSSYGSAQAASSLKEGSESPSFDVASRCSNNSSSMRPCIVFVVDATAPSFSSGLSQAVAAGLGQVLQDVYLQVDLCLILVTDRLYFIPNYAQALSPTQQEQQQELQLLIVDDVLDPFLPIPVEHCFFRPQDRDRLLWAVSQLPLAINNCLNISQTSAANAALKVAVDLIAERSAGGMVEMFYCTLPDIGVGGLKHSTGASNGPAKATEIHQQDFYNSIITRCFSACACIDVFACPPPNLALELQSLGFPAQQTGGDIHFVPEFCASRDKEWVAAEIKRLFTSCFYFDIEFKLRLSKGLAVEKILVSFSGARSLVDQGTFRLPRLSAQSSLLFQLKHTEQLETQKNVYAQSVCAYTPMHPSRKVPNRRLLRVHSLSLPTTFSLASLFRYAEVDATAFLMARTSAIMELHQEPNWREKAIKNLVEILSAYRINCASASSEGQLILPDSLKLLPVYLQALFKHAAFRQSTVDPQVRLFQLLQFLRMSISEFSTHLYPRLCLLHKSYVQPPTAKERKALERLGDYSGVGDFVWMPLSLPASGTNILSDGVYLCEAGSYMLLYIGQHVRREYIIDLFGFDAKLDERSTAELRLQNVEGTAGAKVLRVIEQIRFEKFDAPFIPLRIVAPRSSDETRLLTHLIEDPLSGDGSYVDFLCDLHKRVHARMEDS